MELIGKIHNLICTGEVLIILVYNNYYIGTIERFEFDANSNMKLIIKTGQQSHVALSANELYIAKVFHSIDELQDHHSNKIEEMKFRFNQFKK